MSGVGDADLAGAGLQVVGYQVAQRVQNPLAQPFALDGGPVLKAARPPRVKALEKLPLVEGHRTLELSSAEFALHLGGIEPDVGLGVQSCRVAGDGHVGSQVLTQAGQRHAQVGHGLRLGAI